MIGEPEKPPGVALVTRDAAIAWARTQQAKQEARPLPDRPNGFRVLGSGTSMYDVRF